MKAISLTQCSNDGWKCNDFKKNSTQLNSTQSKGGFLTTARILSNKGCYREAFKYLKKALDAGECTDVEALDLEAQIFARQGMYLEAESSWLRALEKDPFNPDTRAALVQLKKQHPSENTVQTMGFVFLALIAVTFISFYYSNKIEQGYQGPNILQHTFAAIWSNVGHFGEMTSGYKDQLQNRFGNAVINLETLYQKQPLQPRIDETAAETKAQIISLRENLNTRPKVVTTSRKSSEGLFVSQLEKLDKSKKSPESSILTPVVLKHNSNKSLLEKLKCDITSIESVLTKEYTSKISSSDLKKIEKRIDELEKNIHIFSEKIK